MVHSLLINGYQLKRRSQQAVRARACCLRAVCVQKRRQNFGIRAWWVPTPYGFRSTHLQRRTFSAWGTFAACGLRPGYRFTPSTDDARAQYCQGAHNALTPCVFLNIFLRPLALRTAHLARACCALDKCVVRAYSALPQFIGPMSTRRTHVDRTE